MMTDIRNDDPLYYIYEDIADRYDQGSFSNNATQVKKKKHRHQRLKITGF